MTRKPSRRGARPRVADPSEIEQTDQKIADAIERLDQLGKSPADVFALFETVEAEAEWSADEILTAFELACLCLFRTVQSGDFRPDPVTLTRIALRYADVIRQQGDLIIGYMSRDYEIGKQVREGGAERHDRTHEHIAFRRELVHAINVEILLDWVKRDPTLNTLSDINRHKLIAKRFKKRYGTMISYKTVERDLPYPKNLKKRSKGKKLDTPPVSK